MTSLDLVASDYLTTRDIVEKCLKSTALKCGVPFADVLNIVVDSLWTISILADHVVDPLEIVIPINVEEVTFRLTDRSKPQYQPGIFEVMLPLRSLVHLTLSGVDIQQLQVHDTYLQRLKTLVIEDSDVHTLGILSTPKLCELVLVRCQLKKIQSGALRSCRKLYHIDISGNPDLNEYPMDAFKWCYNDLQVVVGGSPLEKYVDDDFNPLEEGNKGPPLPPNGRYDLTTFDDQLHLSEDVT